MQYSKMKRKSVSGTRSSHGVIRTNGNLADVLRISWSLPDVLRISWSLPDVLRISWSLPDVLRQSSCCMVACRAQVAEFGTLHCSY